MTDAELSQRIAVAVNAVGGVAYYVGGCVRDRLMGRTVKDIDIEVHRVPPQTLYEILSRFGTVTENGKSFGIYGIKGHAVDIAIPRREHTFGAGHRDVIIDSDPYIGVYAACKRRDITMNAIMQNVLTGELTDCFGGTEDIKNGVIRHISDAFPEDPLRVYRVAQFAARFGFSVDERTLSLCSGVDLSALPRERVFEETKKALLQSDRPSAYFEVLKKIGKLGDSFELIGRLIGVPQDPAFHPEGDVWNHTMAVLDAAASMRARANEPLPFMLSALLHDVGKPYTTEADGDGRIHSYGHDDVGTEYAEKALKKLTDDKTIIKYVTDMVRRHMVVYHTIAGGSAVKKINRIFYDSVCPDDLCLLALCDRAGCGRETEKAGDALFSALSTFREYMSRPYVTGNDLIAAGCKEGTELGERLNYAVKLRLAGIDKVTALKQCLSIRIKGKPRD